jgi:hypothetical protein
MEKKYSALRTIAAIMKVLGIIVAILTALSVIAICLVSVMGGAAFDDINREFGLGAYGTGYLTGIFLGLIFALVPVINGGVWALILYAGGEVILVQIDIEENTRGIVYLLRKQLPGTSTPARDIPEP